VGGSDWGHEESVRAGKKLIKWANPEFENWKISARAQV
jgi:hypothetical protein